MSARWLTAMRDQEWHDHVRGLADPILSYIRARRGDSTLPAAPDPR